METLEEVKEKSVDLLKLINKLPNKSKALKVLKVIYPDQAKKYENIMKSLKIIKKTMEEDKLKITNKTKGFLDLKF